MAQQKTVRIPWQPLDDFTRKVLRKGGLSREHAGTIADTLTQASLRGVDTHGYGLLPGYYRRLLKGGINPEPNVRVVKESPAAIIVDGDHGPGQVSTVFAMRQAIARARESGMCWGQIINSNHQGALAYYSLLAANEDMIGISFTGAYPSIAPWGGRVRMVGNNPLAIAVPVEGEKPLVLDMAMSVRAQGVLRLAEERGVPLDEGQAIDKDGNPTRDPKAALEGSLLPMGTYKGFGLTLMLEIMAAVMSGMPHTIKLDMRRYEDTPSRTGHSIAVLNIAFFSDVRQFKREVAEVARAMRASPKRPGFDDILMPGEKEWRLMADREVNGIPFYPGELAPLKRVAQESGVPFPA